MTAAEPGSPARISPRCAAVSTNWRFPGVAPMKQSVSLITLGVSDYERAKAFYGAIGWSPAMDVEETAFFQANGVVLVLWSRDKLAADMDIC